MPYDIQFNESAHSYLIDGLSVPGCTTVTGIFDGLPTDKVVEAVKAGKGAFRRKSNKAMELGTLAHSFCENFIKEGKFPDALQPKEALNAFNLFLKWTEENKIEWIHSEIVVGSKQFMYAGKFDAVALVNGVETLIDFKTSSGIFAEYYYQLSGYSIAYEEMEKTPKLKQRMILWIPKTGGTFEARIVPTPEASDRKVFLSALELYKRLEESKRIIKELSK